MIGSLSVLIEADVEQVLFLFPTTVALGPDIADCGLCSCKDKAAKAAEVMEPKISSSSSDI